MYTQVNSSYCTIVITQLQPAQHWLKHTQPFTTPYSHITQATATILTVPTVTNLLIPIPHTVQQTGVEETQ